MTLAVIYSVGGVVLFSVGLSGLFLCQHPLRKILSMNMAGSGLFLVFVALARRRTNAAADPIPDALVLTGIVVAVSATAVALALYRRLSGSPDATETSEGPDG